jgi:hypothetical protein
MTALWRPVAGAEESVRQLPDEPIFNELVRSWSQQERAVPGVVDPEWTALVERPAWPPTGRHHLAATGRVRPGGTLPGPRPG